jgi:hypothetical protein
VAGTPNSRDHTGTRASFEPRHGEVPARWHVVRKPNPARGRQAVVKSQHAGTSQRYDPGSLPSRPGPQRLPTIGRICERCLAEDPLRSVTCPQANPAAANRCHPAWWQPGGDGKAGAQPARWPVPPAAGSCGESPPRFRRPIPPKRRRSVPIANENHLSYLTHQAHLKITTMPGARSLA